MNRCSLALWAFTLQHGQPHMQCMRVSFSHSCTVCASSLSPAWLCDSLDSARLLHPRDFPSKNTGVGCHFLLQGIFLTQGLNPRLLCLLHCRWILYPLSHRGSPQLHYQTLKSFLIALILWNNIGIINFKLTLEICLLGCHLCDLNKGDFLSWPLWEKYFLNKF